MFKQYRLNNKLTQEQVAEKSQISIRQLQRIEKGESIPEILTLKNLQNVLSIPDEEIISYIKKIGE